MTTKKTITFGNVVLSERKLKSRKKKRNKTWYNDAQRKGKGGYQQ